MADPHTREELIEELHRANERYHESREQWEKWLEAPSKPVLGGQFQTLPILKV